jgi:hypothetical protein
VAIFDDLRKKIKKSFSMCKVQLLVVLCICNNNPMEALIFNNFDKYQLQFFFKNIFLAKNLL